jgi:anaerobic ribonucleoside-triphosphate reductase
MNTVEKTDMFAVYFADYNKVIKYHLKKSDLNSKQISILTENVIQFNKEKQSQNE